MRWLVLPLVCSALAAGSPVHAETVSGTVPVSLTVLPACRVETAPLAFTATAGSSAEAQTPIAVSCSSDTEVGVMLDSGRNGAGGQRHLAGADGTQVAYNIFTDASRTRKWSGAAIVQTVDAGEPLQLVAYGRVDAPAMRVEAGEYHDTLTVTVSF